METTKESYLSTINELNQELLAMKDAYEQLDREKQGLMDEVEKQSKLPYEVCGIACSLAFSYHLYAFQLFIGFFGSR